MSKYKKIAAVFALVGLLLALFTVALSLHSRNVPAVLVEASEDAANTARELMEALKQGDFSKAETLLYGTPGLGADRQPADEVGKMVWQAFTDSMDYQFAGQLYATDRGLAQDVSITTLDMASVTRNLKSRSEKLLEERVQMAEDVSQIYDENNEYREEFVMQVLYDAVSQSLQQDAQLVTKDITLNLVYHQQQWWVMPDQALLQVISGGTAG